MSNIKEKIEQLDNVLKINNAPVVRYLKPGLSKEIIIEFLEKNKVYPWPELVTLYEWHNGVDLPQNSIRHSLLEIIPMGIFYNLEYAIKIRQELIEWNYIDNSEDYMPFIGSREDELYCIHNKTGEIFYFSPGIQVFESFKFKSIGIMLDFIIKCFQKKIFFIDSETGLDSLFEEFIYELEKCK